MKKSVLYAVIVVWCACVGAAWAEAEAERRLVEKTYGQERLGYITGWSLEDWFVEEEVPGELNERYILVDADRQRIFIRMPEAWENAAEYYNQGVRFVLDESSLERFPAAEPFSLYNPVSFALDGEKIFGKILELSETGMVLELYEDDEKYSGGEIVSLYFKDSSVARKGDNSGQTAEGEGIGTFFELGTSCEVICNMDTYEVYTMWESNG